MWLTQIPCPQPEWTMFKASERKVVIPILCSTARFSKLEMTVYDLMTDENFCLCVTQRMLMRMLAAALFGVSMGYHTITKTQLQNADS